MSGSPPPPRTPGGWLPITSRPARLAMVMGADQVAPASVERIATSDALPCCDPGASTKTSTRVPSGRTAISFPTGVPASEAIDRGPDHVPPASVVVTSSTEPRRPGWPPPSFSPPPVRSHTMYARPGRVGSAVTDSLSLNCAAVSLLATALAADQVRPPSRDRLTVTQVSFGWVTESPVRYPVPSGPNDSHGSDTRVGRPAPPGAQAENAGSLRAHVRPASADVAATVPRAAPFDQRSCCQAATIVPTRVGSTATVGSTSEFALTLPGPPRRHDAKGLVTALTTALEPTVVTGASVGAGVALATGDDPEPDGPPVEADPPGGEAESPAL